jgi:hypothetical protein
MPDIEFLTRTGRIITPDWNRKATAGLWSIYPVPAGGLFMREIKITIFDLFLPGIIRYHLLGIG